MTKFTQLIANEYARIESEIHRLGLEDLLKIGEIQIVGCSDSRDGYLLPILEVKELIVPGARTLESSRNKVIAYKKAIIKSGESADPFHEILGFKSFDAHTGIQTRNQHALAEYNSSKRESESGYPTLPISFLIHDNHSGEYFVTERRGATLFSKLKTLRKLNQRNNQSFQNERQKLLDAIHVFNQKQENAGIIYNPSYDTYEKVFSNLIVFPNDFAGYTLFANDNPIYSINANPNRLRKQEANWIDFIADYSEK